MPTLEISTPQLDPIERAELARELTNEFSQATGVDSDIVAIRFCQYESGEFAIGGQLWTGDRDRPYVHIRVFCSRLKQRAKKQLIAGLNKQFTGTSRRADWKVVIHIVEHPYDNIGVWGEMQSNRDKRYARGGFYYELPSD